MRISCLLIEASGRILERSGLRLRKFPDWNIILGIEFACPCSLAQGLVQICCRPATGELAQRNARLQPSQNAG